MAKKSKLKNVLRVGTSAWIYAMLSFCAIFVGVFFIIEQLEFARKGRLLQIISSQMQETETESAETFLQNFIDLKSQGPAKLFKSKKEETLEQIILLAQNFSQKKYAECIFLVELIDSGQHLSKPEKVETLLSILKDLPLVEETANVESLEIQELKVNLQQIENDFLSLRNSLASFFGLRATENGKMKFYKEGILEGLPYLEQIPDNLESALAFASELQKANGRIAFPDDTDQQAFFKEQIEVFKDKAFSISMSYSGTEQKLLNLHELNSKKLELLDQKRLEADNIIKAISLEVAQSLTD